MREKYGGAPAFELIEMSATTENMRWTTRSSFIFVYFRVMNGCIVRSLPTVRSLRVEFFHGMFFFRAHQNDNKITIRDAQTNEAIRNQKRRV